MDVRKVFEQLKIDEGVVYRIYEDHLGHPTFGVGHLIREEDPEHGMPIGTEVSRERVWDVFQQDLDIAIHECHMLYGDQFMTWPSEVKEILINMMFNLGRTRLGKFRKFRAALEKRDWQLAAKEGRDSLWYRQVTNRAERLMSRLERVYNP